MVAYLGDNIMPKHMGIKETIDRIWRQYLDGLITRSERDIQIIKMLTNDLEFETNRLYDVIFNG